MRLVSDHQMPVLKHHGGFKGYDRLIGNVPVVVDPHMALVGAPGRDRHAELVGHLPGCHARKPCGARNGRKVLDQKVRDGGPGTRRQADATGADA